MRNRTNRPLSTDIQILRWKENSNFSCWRTNATLNSWRGCLRRCPRESANLARCYAYGTRRFAADRIALDWTHVVAWLKSNGYRIADAQLGS